MVKISFVFLAATLGVASAFVPLRQSSNAFVAPSLRMSEEPTTDESTAEAPTNTAALVPIKEETVEFTAGLIGGAAGFLVGGPWLGAIAAATTNYVSKNSGDVNDVVRAVSGTSIEIYNYLNKLDAKYEILTKTQASLQEALKKLKDSQSDAATIEKVEAALASTTSKIQDINDEYDLVGAGTTALGVLGDFIDQAVEKVGELNDEYKLTDKALDSLKAAVDKAKSAATSATS